MNAHFKARDVLDRLDDDARRPRSHFLDLDHGYVYPVDQRLTLYADETDWVITIEGLGVNPRRGGLGGVWTDVYFHGTAVCLPPQPGWGDHAILSVGGIQDGPSGLLLTAHFSEEIELSRTDVMVRGQVVPIRTDSNYYWARKIDVDTLTHKQIDDWIQALDGSNITEELVQRGRQMYEDMRRDVGRFKLRTWHLLRGMIPEHRDLLLATEDERRAGVPARLRRLLQIDEWVHPKLMEGELPSSSESFKLLARVLAAGDPSLYSPTEPSNTHWSNWKLAGTL